MTTNHPAHGPVSIDRLHQISEILSKAAAQIDGGNIGYAMADAVKVIDGAIAAFGAAPIGEVIEQQSGVMMDGLVISEKPTYRNIKGIHKMKMMPMGTKFYTAPPASVVPDTLPCPVFLEPGLKFGKGVRTQCVLDALRRRADYYAELEAMTPEQRAEHDAGVAEFKAMIGNGGRGDMVDNDPQHAIHTAPTLDADGESAFPQRAMLQAGNSPALSPIDHGYRPDCECSGCIATARICEELASNPPVTPDGWIPLSERMPDDDTYVVAADVAHGEIYSAFAAWFIHGRFSVMEGLSASNYDGGAIIEIDTPITHWMPLPAAPQQEV